MTRVAHVVVDAINDNAELRGPDRYLINLLRELADLQPKCTFEVCHAPWQHAVKTSAFPDNVRMVELAPPRKAVARSVWHASVFPRWADSRRADVVFLPNIIYTPRLRTPSLMTVHDLAHFRFPEKFGRLKGRLQRVQIRLAMKVPRKLVAVSAFTRGDMARYTGVRDERVVEIGEGAPEAVLRDGQTADPPMLLYVGRVERSKNVESLVDAFASSTTLKERRARLVIVGTPGNAEEAVQRRIQAAGDPRIQRLGFVSEEELRQLYLSATAFVFPSVMEGFGLVLLEAMAFGAPVLAMNASAIPDVVGDAAILIDPAKPDALRRAMERVVTDEKLQADLTRRGYERLTHHSWKNVAREMWNEFEQIGGRR
jgi:glycosyltransferase involved in cell wall biosynthesis